MLYDSLTFIDGTVGPIIGALINSTTMIRDKNPFLQTVAFNRKTKKQMNPLQLGPMHT